MPHRRTVLMGIGAVGVAVASRAVTSRARDTLELVIPVPPTSITVEGVEQLVYEIHLASSAVCRFLRRISESMMQHRVVCSWQSSRAKHSRGAMREWMSRLR